MSLKEDEMNLINAEFEPQYKFLEEKRKAGLISQEEYETNLQQIRQYEEECKALIELEFSEKEQQINNDLEEHRLQKESQLREILKKRQHEESSTAYNELQQLYEDHPVIKDYL